VKQTSYPPATGIKECFCRKIPNVRSVLKKPLQNFFQTVQGVQVMKISEDWLSVIIAFAIIVLALIGVITPAMTKF